jgi:capsular polysaccharide transport system permease protein
MVMQNPPENSPPAARPRSFGSLRAVLALILREMATTYGRSPGGYVWAILEPAAGIALLSIVFAAAFRTPALGVSFPMFYATGMLPFTMFSDVQGKVALSLMFSKQLLTYPTVTFVDAMLARFLLNAMTQVMVGYIILVGCMMLFETRVTPDLPVIVLSYALAALLALGVGTLNCFLFSRFALMQRVWSILMRPMFLISGIFFLFETLPSTYQNILWYNPLVHVIGLMRRGFYPTYDATYVSVPYVAGISLVCMAAGLLFLRRHHRDLLQN